MDTLSKPGIIHIHSKKIYTALSVGLKKTKLQTKFFPLGDPVFFFFLLLLLFWIFFRSSLSGYTVQAWKLKIFNIVILHCVVLVRVQFSLECLIAKWEYLMDNRRNVASAFCNKFTQG